MSTDMNRARLLGYCIVGSIISGAVCPQVHLGSLLPYGVAGYVAAKTYYDYKKQERDLWLKAKNKSIIIQGVADGGVQKAAAIAVNFVLKDAQPGSDDSMNRLTDGSQQVEGKNDDHSQHLAEQYHDKAMVEFVCTNVRLATTELYRLQATSCLKRFCTINAYTMATLYGASWTLHRCAASLCPVQMNIAQAWHGSAVGLCGVIAAAWYTKRNIPHPVINRDQQAEHSLSLGKIFPGCGKIVGWFALSTLVCWAWRNDLSRFSRLLATSSPQVVIYTLL